ncbi:MAG: glycosyltransferase family 4 protein [Leptolyngbya sp. SIO4C1]|nr:glycosyltransferase family 4 protein [Leptolyngbya sp. SIO4C1]
MKQRICITTLEFPPDLGGVGESVSRIAQLLTALGYEVHIAVFHSKHRKAAGLHRTTMHTQYQGELCVHRLSPALRSDQPIVQDYLSEAYFQLKQLHERYRFDLFHAFFVNETGFLTTLLAKEAAVPVITSVRGSDLHKHIFSPKQQGQIVWTLSQSDWVTFVSQDLQRRGCVLVPELQQKSSAFWNSIQPIDFSALPEPLLADRLTGLVIGSVGRFRDKKGLEYLLDACADLRRELPLTLLLVGDFAAREQTYWQQQIAQSELADSVVVTGMIDRAQGLAYLPYVDIYAIPSLHDGCPNALLEAMLAKRAIVGTTVDAIGEILMHEQNGWVVPPAATEDLTAALRQLAQSPELRSRLGQAAYQTATRFLSPAVEQAHWGNVYQQVLASPQPVVEPLSLSALAL